MMKLTENVDLEITLSSISGFIVGDVGDIVGSPLKRLTRLESSLVDDLLDAHVVGKDRLVPGHESRSVGCSDPQVT